jgi:hypothetical protein
VLIDKSGAAIGRINAVNCGNPILIVSEDPSRLTRVAPPPITTGDSQLLISSCDNPPGT